MTPHTPGFLVIRNMLKKLLVFGLTIFFLSTISVQKVEAEPVVSKQPEQRMTIVAKAADPRVLILEKYLAQFNSPLKEHAGDFVRYADEYDLDWKLVASIAGLESTYGKRIPGGHAPEFSSYNAWGWGVYGDQALGFQSWTDGIQTVSKGLKEDYISRGLTDPFLMNRRYAASPTWGVRVDFIMKQIDTFAKAQNIVESDELVAYTNIDNRTFSPSAKIAAKTLDIPFFPNN
jgi:hypothetical protein